MNIVQFVKVELHFKYFCNFLQGAFQMIEASIEHTKPTGTHSEKEGGFQLAEDLGDWHKKKDLSLTNKNVHGFNNLIKFMSCSKLLD